MIWVFPFDIWPRISGKEKSSRFLLSDEWATIAVLLPALRVEFGMHPMFAPFFERFCLRCDVMPISRRLNEIDTTGRAILADLNGASPFTDGEKPALPLVKRHHEFAMLLCDIGLQ